MKEKIELWASDNNLVRVILTEDSESDYGKITVYTGNNQKEVIKDVSKDAAASIAASIQNAYVEGVGVGHRDGLFEHR
jgi:hypothetical protein